MAKKDATKPAIQKLMYRRQEAAFALGLSVRSIDSMISDKRLTTRRWGTAVLIPASDVQRVADTIMRSDMLQGAALDCKKSA